ncbi:hypothetical protein MKQ68_07805 [Chitinophaga horti]|uniref:Uncharacterized protein n=1 Tax=Chitinophaga horti TaxID=2920382 RepID=A0ABY6J9I1_9BACT|nr:hypothetical protein [Chitinophaga horti]UYQ94997.1 hypothetical protein MKQ68_07805 [Chitinophaga horti]
MKKVIYPLILALLVVSGLVFANRETEKEAPKKAAAQPLTEAELRAARQQWEATPGGIAYKNWKASPEGKKVLAASAKIQRCNKGYSDLEAVITSLSLPAGSRLGFGVMASIDGEDYILRFDDDPQQLRSLKVNDVIMIKPHSVSHAPKYAYPIVAGEQVERDGKILYKHLPWKGC